MGEAHGVFGSCILLKEVFEDDLGHLFRAGVIEGNAIDRTIWLRVFDAEGLPIERITSSLEQARRVSEAINGTHLPTEPLFFQTDGIPAMGCDYVPGQPLNQVLARARDEAFPLQPDNTLLIVEKIALALTAGESMGESGNGLWHGFLHPGLINLTNDGETLVMGFGLGEALLGGVGEDLAPGAWAYLAPEVFADRKGSQTGDVYSLGAILFHLLTGTALPVAPEERTAALEAAHVAWDAEELASDLKAILNRALAARPDDRYPSASDFRSELNRLLYGGAYSPTTFNLALFMDRLFRSEIEKDELALQTETEIDLSPYIVLDSALPESEVEAEEPAPEAVAPQDERRGNRVLWGVFGTIAIIGIAAFTFWMGREAGPQGPPPTPTPTAAEIAALRQAQDDRLRSLTQEMVKEMMAEREEQIREELIARQTRIEELQSRLQRSEWRAAQSAAAATKEAETQMALMVEIEKQEEAQRVQQDALETERQEAMEEAGEKATLDPAAVTAGATVAGTTDAQTAVETAPSLAPSPTSPPPTAIMKTASPSVGFGDFVRPEEADSVPVVIKSQSLTWSRLAQRSGGKGVVVIQLTVNADGGVDEVTVLRADHTGWGIPEAAAEAASGYRFKPGTKDGVAIKTHAFITWRYDFTDQ